MAATVMVPPPRQGVVVQGSTTGECAAMAAAHASAIAAAGTATGSRAPHAVPVLRCSSARRGVMW